MNGSRERGTRNGAIAAIAFTVAFLATGHTAPAAGTSKPATAEPSTERTGLTETAAVTLFLLDVEVRDAQGRPVRGLRKEDFKVKVGLREWPIYSVDDLCTCSDPGGTAAARLETTATSPEPDAAEGAARAPDSEAPSIAATAPMDPLRYVFYFDFGELQPSGRFIAVREARRWITDVKKPGDEVMIAAYTEQRGLVEVSPFTADSSRLLKALAGAEADAKLMDSFSVEMGSRIRDCSEDTVRCLGWCSVGGGASSELACSQCYPTLLCQTLARDEYMHGRSSLLGLKDLLVDLESIPGRKALLHFQQNGTVLPGRLYGDHSQRTDDHVHLMDELGAQANLSRTAIHGAYVGDALGAASCGCWEKELSDQSLTLASNLADFTGGTYGRDLNAIQDLTSAVRQECACMYRVGLEAPAKLDDRIYAMQVEVRGRPLPHQYRVVFLDDAARWMRQALTVLRNPERTSQLSIGAALVPGAYSEKKGYSVRVQVAFDLDELAMIPGGGGRTGSWEAGALLARDDGEQQWDLLSVSSVRRSVSGQPPAADAAGTGTASQPGVPSPPPSGSWVLHERVFDGLASGRYTLRAFVRDRTALLIGGASAVLDLPPPGRDGLSGPELFHPARRHLVAGLPLFKKKEAAEGRISETRTGEVPAPSAVRAGEPIEAVTWICPREARRSAKGAPKGHPGDPGEDGVAATREHGAPGDDGVRTLAAAVTSDLKAEDGEAAPLPPPRITREGACYRVQDALATGSLAPGAYTYAIHWKSSRSSKPTTAEARFTVQPAAGGQDPGVAARLAPEK